MLFKCNVNGYQSYIFDYIEKKNVTPFFDPQEGREGEVWACNSRGVKSFAFPKFSKYATILTLCM
jgi:hypothetical protein